MGQSALKGHNSDAPVDVAADRIEVQDRADRAVFSGNVVVRQAELTMTAARLTVAYSSAGGIQIERLDASGGVTVRSPSETARGRFAIYDLERRIITLIGAVTLTRGASHVSGGRLVLDLDTGRAVIDGGARARHQQPRRAGDGDVHGAEEKGRLRRPFRGRPHRAGTASAITVRAVALAVPLSG